MNPIRFVPALAVLGLVAAVPAKAQENVPDVNKPTVTIGGGGVYMPDYEGSNDYHWRAAPAALGQIHGFNFTLAGNRLSIDLIPNDPGPNWDVQLGPVAVVNFNRSSIKSIKDTRIKALGELDTAYELGGYIGVGKTGVITSDYDKLSFSLSYRHDVNGVHHSGIVAPTINYTTPLSRKALVGLLVSAEHVERDYAQTYFGVTAAQSTASGLPVYSPRGGWKNYTLGAFAAYAITGDLTHGFKIVAGGTYQRLLNDFGRSPVVSTAGDRNQWLGAVGLAYTF